MKSGEQDLGYELVLNVTNALGTISPMVRTCNVTGVNIVKSVNDSIVDWQSGNSFYCMLKRNIVRNYTDVDIRARSLRASLESEAWGQIFFDISRLAYLLFLQPRDA